jgi:hypothetical protein
MAKVSPRKVLARVALAGLVDGLGVVFVLGLLDDYAAIWV